MPLFKYPNSLHNPLSILLVKLQLLQLYPSTPVPLFSVKQLLMCNDI